MSHSKLKIEELLNLVELIGGDDVARDMLSGKLKVITSHKSIIICGVGIGVHHLTTIIEADLPVVGLVVDDNRFAGIDSLDNNDFSKQLVELLLPKGISKDDLVSLSALVAESKTPFSKINYKKFKNPYLNQSKDFNIKNKTPIRKTSYKHRRK